MTTSNVLLLALAIGVPLTFFWGDPPPELDRLKPDEEIGDSFPARIVLFDRKVATGKDWAYATFIDGWLLIEGLRTSFSLRACDVERISSLDRKGCVFTLSGGQRLQITPLAADREIREAARIWHHYVIESPEGVPILPPRAVHGSAFVGPAFGAFTFLIIAIVGLGISLTGHPVLGTLILAFSGSGFGRAAGALGYLNGRVPLRPMLEAENPS